MRTWLVCVFVVSLTTAAAQRWGKIDSSYTFRLPYTDYLSEWRYGGATMVENDKIRFTPQTRQQSAYMWTNKPVELESWEVILEFGVHGAAPLSTGEGLAFWHVSDTQSEGPVYGNTDQFNGLGVFFDSYDADGNGEAEAYVLAMYNDGAKPIDADGAGIQLGVCFADYRNLPFPARAKISYNKQEEGHLTVGLDIDNSQKFKSCISVKDVKLRPGVEHFGLTVSDYANDFELFNFLGVDISRPYDMPDGDAKDYIQYEDESADKTAATFEHHAHFHRITTRLDGLAERLSSLDDQFRRQFEAMFANHNKGLDYHVTKVQADATDKAGTAGEKMSAIADVMNRMHMTTGQLLSSQRGTVVSPPPAGSDQSGAGARLAQLKASCLTDNHRGSVMTSQLKEAVERLQQRQEDILTDVHSTFDKIRGFVDEGCSEGPFKPVFATLFGVCLGVGSVFFFKKDTSLHLP